LGIAHDTPKVVTKYIGSFHSDIRYSLLLFEPTTIDLASVKAIHIESKGKNERDDHSRKPPFKPPNDKSKTRWNGKENKMAVAKEGERHYCNHYKKEGHDADHCWKKHTCSFQLLLKTSISSKYTRKNSSMKSKRVHSCPS